MNVMKHNEHSTGYAEGKKLVYVSIPHTNAFLLPRLTVASIPKSIPPLSALASQQPFLSSMLSWNSEPGALHPETSIPEISRSDFGKTYRFDDT